MKKFCKYFERGKLFVQISNCEISFNVIIFIKDYELFWFIICKSEKYKQLDICGHRLYYRKRKF